MDTISIFGYFISFFLLA